MLSYILRRALYGVLILIGVNLFTFVLFFTVNTPDDMARLNIGGKRVTQEAIEKWKVERGYDKPLLYNARDDGLRALSNTIFFERSVQLFALRFGASDSGRDIGYEIRKRIGPSLAVALPTFALGVMATVCAALLMVFFRATYLDFWGVTLAVVMMSISSLFYIIVGQWTFSTLLRLVPISGFAGGWDLFKFLALPVVIGVVAVLPLLFLGSLIMESFFGIPGLGSYTIDAINAQDFAVVRAMVFLGSALYIVGLVLTDISYTVADPRIRLA